MGLSLLALAGPVLFASAFAITPGVSTDRPSPALLCESIGDGLVTSSASSSQQSSASEGVQGVFATGDDNDNPRISIGDAGVAEGDSETTPMTFTVSRAGSSHGTSSVHYATQGGTASSGVDFGPAEGLVRDAVFGWAGWIDLFHAAFLVVFGIIMWRVAITRMTRRLID